MINLTIYIPYLIIAVAVLFVIYTIIVCILLRKSDKIIEALKDSIDHFQRTPRPVNSDRPSSKPIEIPSSDSGKQKKKIKPINWEY